MRLPYAQLLLARWAYYAARGLCWSGMAVDDAMLVELLPDNHDAV